MYRKIIRVSLPLLAAILVMVGGGAGIASASSYYGMNPWNASCAGEAGQARRIIAPAGYDSFYGDWVVRDKSGVSAGTVQVWHSDRCRTAWAIYRPNSGFGGEVSIWNSVNQNQKGWSPPSAGAVTNMIDDAPGISTCVGVQVYYQGEWRKWNMGYCY